MSFRTAPPAQPYSGDKQALLTAEIRTAIDNEIAKYPPERKQSAVMAALTLVQDVNGGWLTTDLMDQVAAYLDMPPIAVYEVASFYGMYDLKPVGRHKVCVCNSISCLLNGSDELLTHIEHKYGVVAGGTTSDGKVTFKEFECLGACKDAPVVLIDKTYHERLTPAALDQLIDELD